MEKEDLRECLITPTGKDGVYLFHAWIQEKRTLIHASNADLDMEYPETFGLVEHSVSGTMEKVTPEHITFLS